MSEESTLTVAKEITLTVWQQTAKPGDPTSENIGDRVGKLYKVILKHVREANQGIYE